MKILITGAGGFIAQKLADHFRSVHEVTPLSRTELDITSASAVEEVIEKVEPELIINCAVLGIEACEADPARAKAVNVDGPANLARAAHRVSANIVHFSTNYVFDGVRSDGFYTIDDEPCPVNEYGRTKLEGERAVAAECKHSLIVRTSWVFGGSKLSFFDKAIGSLRHGQTVDAVRDNWASVTFVDDLRGRLSEMIEYGHYGTYHIVNSGICSKFEFAVEAAKLLCVEPELVKPVNSARSLSVRRPAYTPMACKLSVQIGLAPLRDWKDALREYVEREGMTL